MSEVPFAAFRAGMDEKQSSVDMTKVVGNCDILDRKSTRLNSSH